MGPPAPIPGPASVVRTPTPPTPGWVIGDTDMEGGPGLCATPPGVEVKLLRWAISSASILTISAAARAAARFAFGFKPLVGTPTPLDETTSLVLVVVAVTFWG